MSGDEVAIALISLFPAAGIWVPWFLRLVTVRTVTSRGSGHALLGVMPIVCLALLFGVLKASASHDVRGGFEPSGTALSPFSDCVATVPAASDQSYPSHPVPADSRPTNSQFFTANRLQSLCFAGSNRMLCNRF